MYRDDRMRGETPPKTLVRGGMGARDLGLWGLKKNFAWSGVVRSGLVWSGRRAFLTLLLSFVRSFLRSFLRSVCLSVCLFLISYISIPSTASNSLSVVGHWTYIYICIKQHSSRQHRPTQTTTSDVNHGFKTVLVACAEHHQPGNKKPADPGDLYCVLCVRCDGRRPAVLDTHKYHPECWQRLVSLSFFSSFFCVDGR